MERVTGMGGIFSTGRDHEGLRKWYSPALGIVLEECGGAAFPWRAMDNPHEKGMKVWSVFPSPSKYMDPGTAPFMIN